MTATLETIESLETTVVEALVVPAEVVESPVESVEAPVASAEVAEVAEALEIIPKAVVDAIAPVDSEVSTKRKYTKRKKKFSATEQNMLVRDVKSMGLVAATEKWNSLAIYVKAAMVARKVTVPRGRRPGTKNQPKSVE